MHCKIDSGSEQNLIHPEIVNRCKIPVFKLKAPVEVSALDGSTMASITHQTKPVLLVIPGNYHENIQFYLYLNNESPIVLG